MTTNPFDIRYDRETRDFAVTDTRTGAACGWRASSFEAQSLADQLWYDELRRTEAQAAHDADIQVAMDATYTPDSITESGVAASAPTIVTMGLEQRENELSNRCGCFRSVLCGADDASPACLAAGRCLDEHPEPPEPTIEDVARRVAANFAALPKATCEAEEDAIADWLDEALEDLVVAVNRADNPQEVCRAA